MYIYKLIIKSINLSVMERRNYMTTRVGFLQVNITPPTGVLLAGYDHFRLSKGIHDELFGRILIIDHKDELLCFIQMDLICVESYFVQKVYDKVKYLGIKKNNIIVGATHTHSGPKGVSDNINGILKGLEGVFGDYNKELVEDYVSKLADGVKVALDNREKCEIQIGISNVYDVCSERHSIEFPWDTGLFTMEFLLNSGKKILMYNFSCHPTIMNQENLYITADLPAGVLKYLEDSYDMVIFTNGSAGDISTRFTRKGSSFDEVNRLGENLANAIKNSLENPIYKGSIYDVKVKNYNLDVEIRDIDSVEDAEKVVCKLKEKVAEAKKKGINPNDLRLIESEYEGACTNLRFAKYIDKMEKVSLEINIIKINDWNFVTIPGELFSSLGKNIKDTGKNIILGFTNGYYLYFSDKKSYDDKAYEASSSIIKRGQGEKIISFVLDKLKKDFS